LGSAGGTINDEKDITDEECYMIVAMIVAFSDQKV
jgi:hypothetical protein